MTIYSQTITPSVSPMGSLIIRSAMLSLEVGALLIRTMCLPEKYLISPAAGYTVSEVPPIISISAFRICFIAPLTTLSSSPSSYRTTLGLIIPLQTPPVSSLT